MKLALDIFTTTRIVIDDAGLESKRKISFPINTICYLEDVTSDWPDESGVTCIVDNLGACFRVVESFDRMLALWKLARKQQSFFSTGIN